MRAAGSTERAQRDQAAARSGYTFAHAGRQVRLGPVAFWIGVGTLVIMAGWSVTAATYLAFRDDVLRTLIAHQAEQQFAYEDRIAELRAQIDRTDQPPIARPGTIPAEARRSDAPPGDARAARHRDKRGDRPGRPPARSRRPRRRAATGSPASATASDGSRPRSIGSSSANAGAQSDGEPLRRQGAPHARRIRPAWAQARYAGRDRRPLRAGKACLQTKASTARSCESTSRAPMPTA